MRVVLQRVALASVTVGGERVAEIGPGFLLMVGIGAEDGEAEAERVAEKIAGLRVFADADGKMNLALADVGGEVLLVSQFTPYRDLRKGRRARRGPAPPSRAWRPCASRGSPGRWNRGACGGRGVLGATMEVELVNDGPVTLILDTSEL